MRHNALILAILLLVAILCSCSNAADTSQVSLFYCISEPDFSSVNDLIKPEVRHLQIEPTNYSAFLTQYLQGPKDSDLANPFPDGSKIIRLQLDQSTAHVTVNKEFASISGVDLTLACVCLSLTVRDITGYATVQIHAEDALMDNKESIVIDTNSILLTDAPE